MPPTIPDTRVPARPHRPLRPRQRAMVRQAVAAAIGAGVPADRHQVAALLFGGPAAATPDAPVTPPDETAVTPDAPGEAPDEVVSVADAATRLGVSPNTVRRYLAPSSDKLARLADGVSLASIEALEATR